MQDLMIDLETLGTNNAAPIISIGAALFDIKNKQIGDTFYEVLDVADQIDTKIRFVDSSTIKWWMNQSNAAKTVFKTKATSTKTALENFRTWIITRTDFNKVHPWGNGASFDISLIESLFKDYNIPCPWMFWNVMDLRTYKRFIGKNSPIEKLEGTNHNALDDAINQIKYVFKHS